MLQFNPNAILNDFSERILQSNRRASANTSQRYDLPLHKATLALLDGFRDNPQEMLRALFSSDNDDIRKTVIKSINEGLGSIDKNAITDVLVKLYERYIQAHNENLAVANSVIKLMTAAPRLLSEYKDLPGFLNGIQDPNSAYGTSLRASHAILGQAVDLIESLVNDKDALALLLKRDDLEALQSVFSSFDTSTILDTDKRRIAVDSIRSFSTSVLEQAKPPVAQALSAR